MEKRRGSPLSQEASLVVIPAFRIKSQVGGHGLVLFIKLLPTHLRGVDIQIKDTLTLLEPVKDLLVVKFVSCRPGARVGDARVGGRAGVWVGRVDGWVRPRAGVGSCNKWFKVYPYRKSLAKLSNFIKSVS